MQGMMSTDAASNLVKYLSSDKMTDFVNKLREIMRTMRKQVDSELKYVKKTRSLRKLTGADSPSPSPKKRSSELENLLQELKQRISLLQVDAEAKLAEKQQQQPDELRKLLLIELPYEIDDFIDLITYKGDVSNEKSYSIFKASMGYGRGKKKKLRNDIESVLRFLRKDIESVPCRNEAESQSPSRSARSNPPTTIITEDDRLLRHDQEEEIKKLLLPSDTAHAPNIIAIWGPRGLGKTTLIKNLYNNDTKIRRHFQSFAWVEDMPDQDFQGRNIMQSLLAQLLPSTKQQVMEMSVVELIEGLHRVQKNKKCLIVLSDVSRDNWMSFQAAFPPSHSTRSQILLTTRDKDLAEQIGQAHQILPLDQKQSWELFTSRTELRLEEQATKMMEIVDLCKGSPLAIAILSGYLNTIDTSSSDWATVLADELQSHVSNTENDLEKVVQSIVSFSYYKLHHELQGCFLYLGHFPVGREIRVDDLYVMWIDEGLISDQAEEDLMAVAQSYLEELARRNLVQMLEAEQMPTGRFTSCKLHPLVRDLCIAQAEKEGLYKVIPARQVGNDGSRSLARRLSINSSTHKSRPSSSECAKACRRRLRSLFVFEACEPQPDLRELELLRVLEFNGVDFRGRNLPKGVGGELICLRYLSFKGCYLDNLPASIGELSHLQTLDLRVEAHCRMSIPDVFCNMTTLKRLYFPARFDNPAGVKLSLGNLEDLEILVNFNAQVCDVQDLSVMKKLQTLGAIVEQSHADLQIILGFLTNRVFTDLLDSSLDIRNFNCFSEEKRGVLENLLGCQPLRSLRLEGYIKKWPKEDDEINRLSRKLTEIVLSGTELEADPMPRFGQLPNLRSLTLCNDAYIGKEMECSGFVQLRSLKLMNLRCLEMWSVEERAMPKLMSLAIEKCVKLAMLPAGLKSLAALREVKIVSMPTEFEARLQVIDGKQGDDLAR